ncbi:DUF4118 domain-containing protein [Bradyrhizobium liaoningense]|uniref:DUF4118 domain-containing protein n=1 Tax=Bradyrhizobium liaoningense TaxID=43992 RepID=UPI001BA5D3A9|nr:DUF4118 domain-containing protein [Bradyrhizobium liaoningense]MBR1033052.1 DUF4118 domain-containing protein [Bradyrhizobium liaoningense]
MYKAQTKYMLHVQILEWDKVEMLREPEQTDELRRLAVQLALQLPASIKDARKVLELTTECLDDFLIDKAEAESAAARARRRWRRPRPIEVNATPVPVRPPVFAVFLCCLGALALAAALGAVSVRLIGYGEIGLTMLAISMIALLFGRGAALASSALAYVLTTWAVIPPAWALDWPTTHELCGAALYVLTAVIVPWIQAKREPLREASLRVAARPLRVLLRRAA